MFIKRQLMLFLSALLLVSHSLSASTLLVMGDSLSAAYNLRQEAGWVSLLENQLSQTHPAITVINASVSGETTQGGLSRFEQLLAEYKPKWVILELGANDALRGYPLSQTTNNLEQMIEKTHAIHGQVLLIGNQIPQNYGKRYAQMFYGLYEKIAIKYDIAYLPFMLEGIALNKDLMLSDGLHPNQQGQAVILNNVLPYLIPIIKE